MELEIASQDDQVVRLRVSGGITQKQLHQSEEILPKLAGKDIYTKKLLVDLTNNEFIDSSGINWLMLCHKRFTENQGRLVLHSIPQLVDNVLKILRMESVFEIAATEEEALKVAMGPSPSAPAPKPVYKPTEEAQPSEGEGPETGE